MRRRHWAVTLAGSLLVVSCAGGAASEPTTSTTAGSTSPTSAPALTCDGITPLFPVQQVVSGTPGPCVEWVDIAMGRAARGTTGSASLWSRRTDNQTALIVGAVHTLGQGWFGAEETAISESIVDPAGYTGIPRLFLLRSDGSGVDDLASPWFRLYNPEIAAERNGNLMRDVLPREDFYVAVTDSQKLDVNGLQPVPAPIRLEPVAVYDPAAVTTADPTWAEAVPGALVLVLGYPNETGELTAGVGRVLSNQEAARAVSRLAELGDSEGDVSYEADVEVIIEAEAMPGMSGGPVVDREGRLIAVLVRASEAHGGVQYVRAVRMSWVASRLEAAFLELSPEAQEQIGGFLES